MRLDDMKKNIPETPEFIHEMIQREVEKQLRDAKTVELKKERVKRRTGVRVAAAAAVCILAASTVVYAGVNLYHMYLEKQGTYRVTTGIAADGSGGQIQIPEKIHDIDITTEYIPEGMEWVDELHLEYPEYGRTGGFSFDSALLDSNDLDRAVQDKSVVDCEKRTFGSYEGVYLKYQDLAEDGSFDQRIYLLCQDEYRVITIYIGDDVTKEDAVKVAENIVITENDAVIETAGMKTWSEEMSPEGVSGETGEENTSIAENRLKVYQVKSPFALTVSGEDSKGRETEGQISVRVDSVQTADDLKLIGAEQIPEEWTDVTGTDGKLKENTLSYMKSGDGVNSLDEVVKTENVGQKLIYATVSYTNNSGRELKHVLYLGTLVLMDHEDGRYTIYDPEERSGAGYDYITWDGAAGTAQMTYSSVSEDYDDGGNYIPSLAPGETVQVNMAWIVNENDLDHMYLNLGGEGEAYEFSDEMQKTGLVDIRQL